MAPYCSRLFAPVLPVAHCWLRRVIDEDESRMRCHVSIARESASILPEELHSRTIAGRADYHIISRVQQYFWPACLHPVTSRTQHKIPAPLHTGAGRCTHGLSQLGAVAPVARRAAFLVGRAAVAARPARAPADCRSRRRAVWASLCPPGETSGHSASLAEW